MKKQKVILNEEQIQELVFQISNTINDNYDPNSDSENNFLCVLNGGFMFYSDLVRNINFPIKCDFIRTKSYISNQNQITPQLINDVDYNLENANIWLIDEILETGNTMNYLIQHYLQYRPNTINVATLLKRNSSDFTNKFGETIIGEYIDSESWLVGYGLDDDDTQRNKPYIYIK